MAIPSHEVEKAMKTKRRAKFAAMGRMGLFHLGGKEGDVLDKRLIMYMHAGSGNHGCEAIVNSLCHMIKEQVALVSYRGSEDEAYSLGELCAIIRERSFRGHRLAHLLYYVYRKLTGDQESFIRYRYREVFRGGKVPLAVSIGGDNYCYENMLSDLRLANAAFNRWGTKTVLAGCSIEPGLLEDGGILADLSGYHTIIARESITYEALQEAFERRDREQGREAGGGAGMKTPGLCCYPDPAFTLFPRELPLPEGFAEGNTVGINVSPMVQEKERQEGLTLENYQELIQYIIDRTDMQVALVPHVVWKQSDDRQPLHELHEIFKETGRVVEIRDGDCQELKGYIGRCRLFVGARTHATIAAYSSLVPTLAVGYSVKARGIAKDLFGTWENYVIPVQSLEKPEDLAQGFMWLLAHEEEIRGHLKKIMPDYQKQALLTGKEVDRLWEEFSRH